LLPCAPDLNTESSVLREEEASLLELRRGLLMLLVEECRDRDLNKAEGLEGASKRGGLISLKVASNWEDEVGGKLGREGLGSGPCAGHVSYTAAAAAALSAASLLKLETLSSRSVVANTFRCVRLGSVC
jgi:hypothetical protein